MVGDNVALNPIARATMADRNMISVMARWRPKRSAASLPRTLAGRESRVIKTLIATGPNNTLSALRAAMKVQKETIQVRMP